MPKPAQVLVSVKDEFKKIEDKFATLLDYETRVKEMHKKAVKLLTGEEKRCITDYTGSSYRPINEYLRTGTDTGYKYHADTCKAGIAKCKLEEDIVTYRGSGYKSFADMLGADIKDIEADPQKFIRRRIEMKGFTSTSIAEKVANNFNPKIKFYCKLPKGTEALYVAPISNFGNEKEMLVNAGTEFRIMDIVKGSNGHIAQVYMEAIV